MSVPPGLESSEFSWKRQTHETPWLSDSRPDRLSESHSASSEHKPKADPVSVNLGALPLTLGPLSTHSRPTAHSHGLNNRQDTANILNPEGLFPPLPWFLAPALSGFLPGRTWIQAGRPLSFYPGATWGLYEWPIPTGFASQEITGCRSPGPFEKKQLILFWPENIIYTYSKAAWRNNSWPYHPLPSLY